MRRAGDEFGLSVAAELPFLIRLGVRFSRDLTTAEDLASETVVKALANRDKFEEGTNLRAWLAIILKNTWYSQARKNGREVHCPDGVAGLDSVAPDDQFSVVHFKDVQARMRLLPSRARKALLMVADGVSYEETAAILGTEVGTIKSRVNRARGFLEGMSADAEPAPAPAPSRDDEILRLHAQGLSIREISAALGIRRADVFIVVSA